MRQTHCMPKFVQGNLYKPVIKKQFIRGSHSKSRNHTSFSRTRAQPHYSPYKMISDPKLCPRKCSSSSDTKHILSQPVHFSSNPAMASMSTEDLPSLRGPTMVCTFGFQGSIIVFLVCDGEVNCSFWRTIIS